MKIPYYPSKQDAIRKLLEVYIPPSGTNILDLGSGDARVLIEIAKRYDDAILVGVEKNPLLIEASMRKIGRLGLKNIKLIHADMFKVDLDDYDVIYAYLTRDALNKLRPRLVNFIMEGKEIFTYDIAIPGVKPYEVYRIDTLSKRHKLYRYLRPK